MGNNVLAKMQKVEECINILNKTIESIKRQQKGIIKQFVDGHCPIKVGDIAQDNWGKIKVNKIEYEILWINGAEDVPMWVLSGTSIKNDGTPDKRSTAIKKVHLFAGKIEQVDGVWQKSTE